jgi:hypothetical protein
MGIFVKRFGNLVVSGFINCFSGKNHRFRIGLLCVCAFSEADAAVDGAGFDVGATVAERAFQFFDDRKFLFHDQLFHDQRREFAAHATVDGAGRDFRVGIGGQGDLDPAIDAVE